MVSNRYEVWAAFNRADMWSLLRGTTDKTEAYRLFHRVVNERVFEFVKLVEESEFDNRSVYRHLLNYTRQEPIRRSEIACPTNKNWLQEGF